MKKDSKNTSYNFIAIEEINSTTLTAKVALELQKHIQLNLRGEYPDNFIMFKFVPKTEEELHLLFELVESLKQANYTPIILSLIDNDKEITPYYLKAEWPMVKQER